MKYLRWLLVLALAVLLAAFTIHNHHAVELDLWPLPLGEVKVAVFVLVLAAAFLGFLLGGAVAWLGGKRQRRLARQRGQALAESRRQLEDARRRQVAVPASRE